MGVCGLGLQDVQVESLVERLRGLGHPKPSYDFIVLLLRMRGRGVELEGRVGVIICIYICLYTCLYLYIYIRSDFQRQK